jgi:hypothetical protein
MGSAWQGARVQHKTNVLRCMNSRDCVSQTETRIRCGRLEEENKRLRFARLGLSMLLLLLMMICLLLLLLQRLLLLLLLLPLLHAETGYRRKLSR